MTNLELFLKYNMKANITYNKPKDEQLDYLLYSEQIVPEIEMRKNNWHIMIYSIYDCNLNCGYCKKKLKTNYNNAQISAQTIKSIIQKLGEKIQTLSFIGGEPLLLSDDVISTSMIPGTTLNQRKK